MAQMTIKINGYAYTVACEDGQEAHLRSMAGEVERRIEQVKALGGQSGESQMLVLAGLLMADELHDLGQAIGPGEARSGGARVGLGGDAGGAPGGGGHSGGPGNAVDEQHLRLLADRAEDIAAALERD